MKPQPLVIAMSCVDARAVPLLSAVRAGCHSKAVEPRRMFDCSDTELRTLLEWLALARM
jgi:hypothetical protein